MAETGKPAPSNDKARHQKIAAGLEKAAAEIKKLESQLSALDANAEKLEKALE